MLMDSAALVNSYCYRINNEQAMNSATSRFKLSNKPYNYKHNHNVSSSNIHNHYNNHNTHNHHNHHNHYNHHKCSLNNTTTSQKRNYRTRPTVKTARRNINQNSERNEKAIREREHKQQVKQTEFNQSVAYQSDRSIN